MLLLATSPELQAVRHQINGHATTKSEEIWNLKSEIWNLKKSVPMDKNKRLIDYSPDFERVELKQITTVRDLLEELLSVRDMDEAVVHLFVNLRSKFG